MTTEHDIMQTTPVVYTARILGDGGVIPFKWMLYKQEGDGPRRPVRLASYAWQAGKDGAKTLTETTAEAAGEARTFDEAVQRAEEAAHDAEAQRAWKAASVELEVLTTVRYIDPPTTEEKTNE